MPELTVLGWALLAVGALGVGFAKTAIGGVGSISVALFAWVLPAKGSTGTLLLLLLVGDLVAVAIYRRDVAWRDLGRLVVPVLVGVGVGTVFLRWVSDEVLKTTIGIVLLGLVVLHLARDFTAWRLSRRAKVDDDGPPSTADPSPSRGVKRLLETVGYGVLAGFTTMVANAGGAAMTLYFLAARFSMLRFLGTGAWFFFLVNVIKTVPSLALGLITGESLVICGLLIPVVLVGTWLGRRLIARIDQSRFNAAVLAFTVLSAVILLV
jgi:uncharacterized membrane protein YfcA